MPSITTSDGISLNYEWSGTEGRPVLLFSNSLGTNLHMWDRQVAAFADDFRILRYDSRGHGRSGAPDGPYTIARLGEDAVDLLDALALEKVHYCGLSKGGMVGMWLGANADDRIDKLVLSNTNAYMADKSLWDLRIEAVMDKGMNAIADSIVDRWFTKEFQQRDPAAIAPIRAMIDTTPNQGYAACCMAIRDMDLRPGLPGIGVPTLVIAGKHDPATPPEEGEAIHRAVPGSQFVLLDAAHISNIEAEDAYNTALRDFLA